MWEAWAEVSHCDHFARSAFVEQPSFSTSGKTKAHNVIMYRVTKDTEICSPVMIYVEYRAQEWAGSWTIFTSSINNFVIFIIHIAFSGENNASRETVIIMKAVKTLKENFPTSPI